MDESGRQFCIDNIEKMLKRSQTKIIFPIITFGLLQGFQETKKTEFSDKEISECYRKAVIYMQNLLQHRLHIGGKYYDAYPSRNLPKYKVLQSIGDNHYQLLSPYTEDSEFLISWIPDRIKQHIISKLGIIPQLSDRSFRAEISEDINAFSKIIENQIDINAANFEIVSFSVIKVHLEKFACKVYRDTTTSTYDRGVDLSTNFGVVYQIKKLRVYSKSIADEIYSELKVNFDNDRLTDGNVILFIDDISKEIRKYLINMKVQSISEAEILKLAQQFEDFEDREKILRIIYEKFEREYLSDIV